MPKAEETATIVVNGQRYRDWKTVVVERTHLEPVMTATFSVAEVSSVTSGWAAQKIKIGTPCQVLLAGRKVIDGMVSVRQSAYDPANHGLQVTVCSKTIDAVLASIDAKTGQFKKYPLSAIANSVLSPFGISFEIQGSPEGADKIFDRVNIQVGETPWHLIERLARMRNLFLMPNNDGTGLVAHRAGSDPVVAQLQEGRNIKSAQCVLRDDFAMNKIGVSGQKKGSDDEWGDDARVSATAMNPGVTHNRPLTLVAEEPGDKQDMQMRADREMAENVATTVDCSVMVKGWQCDDGSLWIEHVGKQVSIYSPMLFPTDSMTLYVRSVRHSQGESGTETAISLCLLTGLPGGGPIGTGAGSPATPDPET
jgi:prophage tail gpP-like protein